MLKKVIIPLFFTLGLFQNIQAQSYKKTDWGINLTTDSLNVEISFYSPSIARILKSPKGNSFNKESLSVIKKPQKTTFSIKQQAEVINLKTESMSISIGLKSGNISYYTTAGKSLLQEKESSSRFTPFDDAGNKTFTVFQAFQLDNDETIYGLGTQQRGKMSQRNVTLNMVQGNTEDYIPFFQSVKGY